MKKLILIIILIQISLFSQGYEKGASLYQAGNYKQAITELKKVIDSNKNNYKAYYYLGMCYLVLEDPEAAVDYFTSSIKINNKYADNYNSRGLAYGYIGEVQASLDDFDRAIIIDPNFAEAYLNRATALNGLGRIQEAVEDFSQSLRLSPQNPSVYYQRGQMYMQLGQFDQAIKDINTSINMGYKNPEVFFELGNCYYMSEQWRKAIEQYSEAIRLNPRHDKAINNRAMSYDKIGNKTDAEKDRKTLEKLAGVKFTPIDKIKWKTFKSSDGSVSIDLPDDWFFYEVEKSLDRTEVLITPNKWDEKSPSLLTSVNLVMSRNMKSIYGMSGEDQLIEFWSDSNAKNGEDYFDYKVGSQKLTKIDGLKARVYRTMRKVDNKSIAYESFEVVAASSDNLFYAYLQAPDTQWRYYEQIFEKSIKTLKLR